MYDLSTQQGQQSSAWSITVAASTTIAVGRNLYGLHYRFTRIIAEKEYHPDICGSAHQASSFCCNHVCTGCEEYSGFVCPDSLQASRSQPFNHLRPWPRFHCKNVSRHFQTAGFGSVFVKEKEGSKKKKRTKEEEIEKKEGTLGETQRKFWKKEPHSPDLNLRR